MSDAYAISQPGGMYYLTCTVTGWVDVFTRQRYRDIILQSLAFCSAHKKLSVHAWVVMSNHLHLIASVPDDVSLGNVMRDFKTYTSKAIQSEVATTPEESRKDWMLPLFKGSGVSNGGFWQGGNHAVVLYSPAVIRQKLDYIHRNPVRAGWVRLPEEYLYSSAIDYRGGRGLLEIEPLIFKEFV